MAEATEADRERARGIIIAGEAGPESWTQVLAVALAAERAQAQAPFLALADELIREAPEQEAWDGNVDAAYTDIAQRIRAAAQGPT